MTDLLVREVLTRRDLRKFIYLPEKIHKNDPEWLPPIYMDEWELFDRKKNRAFSYSDTALWLAFRGKKPVGRIMGIINRRYNEIHRENHGRFCFMECYEDQEVFHALISAAEDWARKRNMERIVGPLGFSDKDPQGFKIEGFEYPSFIVSATNLPYMPVMLEREGYTKKTDLVNYFIKIPEKLPGVYERAYTRIHRNNHFKVIEFNSKREIKKYILPVLELLNQTFIEIYGFVPLDDREKMDLAKRYLTILDPEFVKVVESEGRVIGFAVGIPDISQGIKAAKGKLFPFGFIKILKASKRSETLLMMLGGIKKEFRNQGVDVLMAVRIIDSCIRNNMDSINVHLILETNKTMIGECEKMGGRILRKWRIYDKPL
jgi:GNAT superfamily N-acetyltransferase